MAFDLILKGGRIIDPSQKLDRVADIAFSAGKVAKIDAGLRPDRGTEVRDVSGYIVTPGLIDLHTHVYWGGTSLGIMRDCFPRLALAPATILPVAELQPVLRRIDLCSGHVRVVIEVSFAIEILG
jgi:imidazolonepropionase-like amidohydrolase